MHTTIDRRQFLATSLASGFALAVQPVVAQTTIHTAADGLLAGEVSIPVANGQMPAYRAVMSADQAKTAPVVLVVSEIFGVHEYIRDLCRRLAKQGYYAIAPDLFVRQGDPQKLASIAEISAQIVSRTPDSDVMADLDATLNWAQQHGASSNKVLITGFCWGGRITWLYAAHNPQVQAGVAWYGRLTGPVNAMTPRHPIDVVNSLKAPVLGIYGGADTGIPQASVDAMLTALKGGGAAAQASTIHVYADAPHAFHADYRPSYRPAAAEDGWQRLLAWFQKAGNR